MERVLKDLVERLTKALGDRLVSVVLYGSGAVGDHQKNFSDFNILCVLTQVTPQELSDSEMIFRWWREQGNPSPLLLSEQEVQTSTDCFAIEFHDIVRQNRVLYGRDVIEGLPIDDSFYRAQVEYELRAKLLRLRQKASGILSDKVLLRQLLADSLSTFSVLIRHALALHGVEPDMRKRETIEQARETLGIDAAPFELLLDFRDGRVKPSDFDPAPFLGSYLKQISVVIDAVDQLAK
jgi:hypothetical protein